MRVASFLLCIIHKIPDDVQKYYLQLVSKLMLYDIIMDDVHLLLRLALVSPKESGKVLRMSLDDSGVGGNNNDDISDSGKLSEEQIQVSIDSLIKRREELQMQIFYIIGCAVERQSPQSYFNYEGGNGCLRFTSIHDFPPGSLGYTISCWVRLTNIKVPNLVFFFVLQINRKLL